MTRQLRVIDCLIIGGGPAGLTAAIYLARFHLAASIIDAGNGRAQLIPITRNHAGFPDGINGLELVDRMKRQALRFGALYHHNKVSSLKKEGETFIAEYGEEPVRARSVLLATGVVNRRPDIADDLHAKALQNGVLRYCPICDGFEVTDENIAVIGTGEKGLNEALFLRSYTKQVTLISPDSNHELDPEMMQIALNAQIAVVGGPAKILDADQQKIVVKSGDNNLIFDSAYPSLGSDINNMLAKMAGAKLSNVGCVIVDAHQRTSVQGLYAAGDVVLGLDQISNAMGNGAVAATTIRNDLAQQKPIFR